MEYAVGDGELRLELARACNHAGGQTRWAESHGVSQGFVSRVLRGERPFSRKLLKAMGYQEEGVTIYRKAG
jgi:hypothetical protein